MAKRKVMSKDISNKVVVIMLIAVIVVSVTGLGFYISALDNAGPEELVGGQAKVSLTIMEPQKEDSFVASSSEKAKASLTIKK